MHYIYIYIYVYIHYMYIHYIYIYIYISLCLSLSLYIYIHMTHLHSRVLTCSAYTGPGAVKGCPPPSSPRLVYRFYARRALAERTSAPLHMTTARCSQVARLVPPERIDARSLDTRSRVFLCVYIIYIYIYMYRCIYIYIYMYIHL